MPAISNTPPQQLERKEHGGIYGVQRGMGRSRGYIDCPFCLTAVLCYGIADAMLEARKK